VTAPPAPAPPSQTLVLDYAHGDPSRVVAHRRCPNGHRAYATVDALDRLDSNPQDPEAPRWDCDDSGNDCSWTGTELTRDEAVEIEGWCQQHPMRRLPVVATIASSQPNLNELLGKYRAATDTGNAERLADRAKDRLKWVKGLGWLVWDGKRWRADNTNRVLREAKTVVRGIYAEAADLTAAASALTDNADRDTVAGRAKELLSWARQSESRARIDAMVHLATGEERLVATIEQLDDDPYVLNVENGILDLRTLELRERHPQRDLVTKVARAKYDPRATAPFWEQTLELALPDLEVRRWVQKAVGYSIRGVPSEYLFMPHGVGANLKSTVLSGIRDALGDYAQMAAPDLLVAKKGGEWSAGSMSAVASLRGARLVTTIETERGRKMAEVLVKQLTGENVITAKFMRQDTFEFEVTVAVWLATNYLPVVQGADHAIWRRLRSIPFTQVIAEERRLSQDEVRERLLAERDGILRWMIDGLRMYLADGSMDPAPAAVTEATDEYRRQMDGVGQFIEQRCKEEPSAWEANGPLHAAYRQWCEQEGRLPVGSTTFGQELGARGLVADRRSVAGKRTRGWARIRLRGPLEV
jgi:putative DNA primase/helicase